MSRIACPPVLARSLPALVALLAAVPAPAQIHVDDDAIGANDGSTWQDAYTDLQDGIAAAQDGDEIWLAEGVYRPSQTGDRLASFRIHSPFVIHGGFRGGEPSLDARQGSVHKTILSGDLNGDDGPGFANRSDNSAHVVVVDYFVQGGIERVTVRGGQADLPYEDGYGGGLYAGAPYPQVAVDCVFRDNQAVRGGGAYAVGWSSFHGCTFVGNRALERGGGLLANMWQTVEPYVERCRFLGNEVLGTGAADEGGGGLWGTGGAVFSCEFSGNRAPVGGALHWAGGELRGLSVSHNRAAHAGGIRADSADLQSSVLWDNRDASGSVEEAQLWLTGVFAVRACCIQGWTGALGGERVQDADPRFADPLGPDGLAGTADDDLALLAGSPCVDRGEPPPAWWEADDRDVAGRPRFVDALACGDGGVMDVGAHERQAVDGASGYCDAAPSSLGVPAVLRVPCVQGVALEPRLVLEAGPVPDGPGAFLFGAAPTRAPLGDGVLCVGAPRALGWFPAAGGVLRAEVDLTQPPADAFLVPGSTWFVQALYRDVGGAGLNLSSAASLELRD